MSLMMTFGEKQTRRFLPEYRVRGSAVCYASHHNGGVVVEEFRVLPPLDAEPPGLGCRGSRHGNG